MHLIVKIEHVGSTVIPGIKSKPILDINILTPSISEAQVFIGLIKSIGYQYWDSNVDMTKMFFMKGMPPFGEGRTHHIWIFEDSIDFENRVLFETIYALIPR